MMEPEEGDNGREKDKGKERGKPVKRKSFPLTNLALNNRTTILLATLMVALFGIESYVTLPKDSFPEISINKIYIGTPYPGNSPVDIENLITRPIEKELNTISEIDEINSVTVQDYATIIVDFPPEMDIQEALTKVKDAVDKAKSELPTDLEQDPNVFEFDFGQMPILNINLSGDYDIEQLERYAEELKEDVERLSEVAKVEIRGVDEKEVEVLVDPYKMDATKVSFGDIEQAVASENLTMSGGDVMEGGLRRSVRIIGEIKDPQQLEYIVVRSEKGDVVHLRDVATVRFGYRSEKNTYARLSQKPVVSVDITKRSGQNLLLATDKIYRIIDKVSKRLPQDLSMSITNDQSDYTRQMVSGLENNIIFGVLLVVLVLQFFLGTRNALFVGMAIPLSMFLSFCILALLGATINMMVLFSLIMALGMLVDNGIVVVENCYRLMETGLSRWAAAKQGVGEVAKPIISSTMTTLGAFFPLALWPGMMGEFMRYLPITLIITLSSSLVVALVINPVAISLMMEQGKKQLNRKKLHRTVLWMLGLGVAFLLLKGHAIGNLSILLGLFLLLNAYVLTPFTQRFQNHFLPAVERRYAKTLRLALHNKGPYLFFAGTVVLFIFSFVLMFAFQPKVLFFPENEPKYINVFMEHPLGTDIEETNQFCQEIEEKVMEVVRPYEYMVNSVIAKVGAGAADPNDIQSSSPGETPHKALIMVDFKDSKLRKGQSTSDIMEQIRQAVRGYPGVFITVDKNRDGPPVGKAISIQITGDDFKTLIRLADNMKHFLLRSGIQGIEELKADLEANKPEISVRIDKEKARRFGLSTGMVAQEIRTSLFGKEISKFKQGEEDYDIYVRLNDDNRHQLQAVLNKQITFRNQSNGQLMGVPISSVADIRYNNTYNNIKRKNLLRIVHLESNVIGGFNPTEVNQQIQSVLTGFDMPAGYNFEFGGEQEKQKEEMAFLSKALLIAVFLILIIIIAQFNRVVSPFIIMTTVLFSLIGVLLGLVMFQMDFIVIMTMIGIISLAGIVVNNAIVLLDFIEFTKKKRKDALGVEVLPFEETVQAIMEAGRVRLRPVLLTAITTVLGLIPLAIGLNIDFIQFFQNYDPDLYVGGDTVKFWGPIAWTIIFGLSFATFLTLVIVPVMYWFFERMLHLYRQRRKPSLAPSES